MTGRLVAIGIVIVVAGALLGAFLAASSGKAGHANGEPNTMRITLSAQNSGKCMAIGAGADRNGSFAIQFECGAYPDQQIDVVDAGDGWHYLKFVHSGKCLTIHGEARNDGAVLEQWDCLGQANQKWNGSFIGDAFEPHSSQLNPTKCVTVKDESKADGAVITQWECLGQPNQAWQASPAQ